MQHETYGERRIRLWRAGEFGEFTRAESLEMREADAWAAAHPALVRELEALVGRLVWLTKPHRTFAEDVLDPRDAKGIPRFYPKDSTYLVIIRSRDRLLARATLDNAPMLLHREWVHVPVRAPRRILL